MSKRKTERLLGLVVCLLSTSRYLSADQVRAAVPGYPEQDDLFKRMFERDKEDLRELGVPLETGLNHPFDDDPGYRIRQQAYELPELRLEADEAAVLGLAARVWRRAELAGAAAGALLKLQAAGIDTARLEGAGPMRELLHVTWPMTMHGFGWTTLVLTALCLGEVAASNGVQTPGSATFVNVLLDRMHTGVGSTVAALCLMLLAWLVVVLAVGSAVYRLVLGNPRRVD